MRGILATVGVAGCGLALLAPLAVLRAATQEQTSEQALIERLRQSQGEIGRTQPPGAPARPAEELIQEIEVIERQLRSGTPGQRLGLSEEEVRGLVSEGLGVEVLKAETVEHEGRQVYAVTVMNPPGNYDGALMVRTLLVDRTTGGLLGEVPHTPRTAATDVAPSAPAAGPDGGGREIRRRTHR
jgi:hypothetical protein